MPPMPGSRAGASPRRGMPVLSLPDQKPAGNAGPAGAGAAGWARADGRVLAVPVAGRAVPVRPADADEPAAAGRAAGLGSGTSALSTAATIPTQAAAATPMRIASLPVRRPPPGLRCPGWPVLDAPLLVIRASLPAQPGETRRSDAR